MQASPTGIGRAEVGKSTGLLGGASGGTEGRGSPRRPIPPKLYRIGEVATYAGMSRQTIHNYTTMGLLQESQWSNGGHRLYDETVFLRLDEILSMRAERRSLQDIRRRFVGSGVPAAANAGAGASEPGSG